MKVVILAGGAGTRIAEETLIRPKPMITIGSQPILWHIMKIYGAAGINDFIVCLGYKGYVIKEYFANYFLNTSDVTFDLSTNRMEVHSHQGDPWRVTLVETGENTMTGGRILRVKGYLHDESFCLTYGDGVSDVSISHLIEAHKRSRLWATVTAVQPPGRFGALRIREGRVTQFEEKPPGDGDWINGGFFVFGPQIFQFLKDDQTVLEQEPLRELARSGQLNAFHHSGFWHTLDTINDRTQLQRLWNRGDAPWKTW